MNYWIISYAAADNKKQRTMVLNRIEPIIKKEIQDPPLLPSSNASLTIYKLMSEISNILIIIE